MVSFGQIFILICLVLLLFGDLRQIFNKLILVFVNIKTIFKKTAEEEKKPLEKKK